MRRKTSFCGGQRQNQDLKIATKTPRSPRKIVKKRKIRIVHLANAEIRFMIFKEVQAGFPIKPGMTGLRDYGITGF